MNYARALPLDRNNVPYPAPPSATATNQWVGVPTSSSVFGISPNSTVVEITCLGGQAGNAAVLGKWGNAAVSTSNYDFVVASGATRPFVIPVSVFGSPQASVAGIRDQNGLYKTVALITATAQSASVFAVEY